MIGVLFWIASSYLKPDSSADLSSLALIDRVNGKAFVKNAANEIVNATALQKLHANESLMTDHDTTLIFHLTSGASFEVAAFSKIIFEEIGSGASSRISITILEGQIQLLNDSLSDSFDVSKKGQSLSLSELKTEIPKPKIKEPVTKEIATTSEKARSGHSGKLQTDKILKSGSSLSDDDINRVMHNQTSFLHRCYINYMLRTQNLNLGGQVVLSFLIEPSGQVKDSKVVSSPIPDEQLNHCMVDVVNRANFKEFSAQPVFVQAYPIHLD